MGNEVKEIKVDFPRELRSGAYANQLAVGHSREEFIMDFLMVAPPAGTVAARIVVSPGHMKRLVRTLRENVAKYEENFGPIQTAEGPKGKVTLQ